MLIRIGEAEIFTNGDAATIGVSADMESWELIASVPDFIVFCEEAGPDVMHLFFGAGWQRADRKCREGFHRALPLIATKGHPAVLAHADIEIIRDARRRRADMNADTTAPDHVMEKLRWLERAMEGAIDLCSPPIFIAA